MIYITVCLRVRDNVKFEEAFEAIKEVESLTMNEKGCKYFHAHTASLEKRQIMLWEIWDDKISVENSHNTEYYKSFANKKYMIPEFVFENEVL